MSWSFVVCDLNGNALGSPEAQNRSYDPAISATETASFGVRAGSALWNQIVSGSATLKVFDSFNQLRLWGDVVTDEITGSGQGGSVQFNASDLSLRLSERFVGKDANGVGLAYVNQDARSIAFDLLARANAEAATGVVAGVGNVGLSTAPPFTPVAGTFGKTTAGSAQDSLLGDYYKGNPSGSLNKQVSRFTLGERATLSSLSMDVAFGTDALATYTRGVVYADAGGTPGALLDTTSEIRLNSGGTGVTRQFVQFTGLTATLDPGPYWLGYIAGETSGQGVIGYEAGGSRAQANDTYLDGASSAFGTAATDAATLSVYASYMTAAPTTTTTGFVGPTVTYLWKNLLDAISELGAVANSFEWKLRYADGTPPTVYLDLVPQVGQDRTTSVFFEYGVGKNNCTTFKQTRTRLRRASHVYALGSAQTLLAEAYDTAAETSPNPRSEDVLTVSDLTDSVLLASLAAQHVAIRRNPRKVVDVTLAPFAPKYGQWEVGDTVTVRARVAGSNIVNGSARVWGATVSPDDGGNENAQPNLEPTS